MADDPLAAEIAQHRLCECGLPHQLEGCAACAGRRPRADRPAGGSGGAGEAGGAGHICVRCGLPITGVMVGMGDGTGQQFGHRSCYWRAEAERLERERDRARGEAVYYAAEFQRAAIQLRWCIDVPRLRRALAPADGEDGA